MDSSPSRPATARRSRLGVLAVVIGALLLLAVPEVAADVAARRVTDQAAPRLVRAPDAPLTTSIAPTTTALPTTTTTTTTAPPPPPPPTTTTRPPATTTAVPSPVRTSVDFGGGLLVEVIAPAGPGPHPTLVYVHGGGWVSGDHLELPAEFALPSMADRGWAVASVGYRLADRDRGVDASHQIAEVARVLSWVRTDGNALGLGGRVVAMGHSAGAHLVTVATASMAPATTPDVVIGIAGVYDLEDDVTGNPFLEPVLPHALGCEPSQCSAERIASFLPATYAGTGDPPVVLVHGADDPIAPLRSADDYAGALRGAGTSIEEVVVGGAGHFDDVLGAAVRQLLDRVLS